MCFDHALMDRPPCHHLAPAPSLTGPSLLLVPCSLIDSPLIIHPLLYVPHHHLASAPSLTALIDRLPCCHLIPTSWLTALHCLWPLALSLTSPLSSSGTLIIVCPMLPY
jgi:hypothetical protein